MTEEDELGFPEKMPEVRSEGICWLFSILAPLGFFGFGVFIALMQSPNESDWMGLGFIIPVVIGSAFAAVTALAFSVLSIFRAERHAMVAFISGGLALIYLIFVVISLSG